MNDSPASVLYDSDGNAVAIMKDGNLTAIGVGDNETRDLLRAILRELKRQTYMLGLATDVSPDLDVEE